MLTDQTDTARLRETGGDTVAVGQPELTVACENAQPILDQIELPELILPGHHKIYFFTVARNGGRRRHRDTGRLDGIIRKIVAEHTGAGDGFDIARQQANATDRVIAAIGYVQPVFYDR